LDNLRVCLNSLSLYVCLNSLSLCLPLLEGFSVNSTNLCLLTV
jgi:hypothetical protein